MKVINERDYSFIGVIDCLSREWYAFKSTTKENFDPEIVLTDRCRFRREDGTSVIYENVSK